MASRPLIRSLLRVTRQNATLMHCARAGSFASFRSSVGGLRSTSSSTSSRPSTYLDPDGALFGESAHQAVLSGGAIPPEGMAILGRFFDRQKMNAAGAEGCEIHSPPPNSSKVDGAWYTPGPEDEGPKLERLTLVLGNAQGEVLVWRRRFDNQAVSPWVHVPRDSAQWPEAGEYTIAGAVNLDSEDPEKPGKS